MCSHTSRKAHLAQRTAALSPPCRGPVRLTNDGRLASAIVEAFNAHGFNTFAGAIHGPELELLQREVAALVDRAPDVLPQSELEWVACLRLVLRVVKKRDTNAEFINPVYMKYSNIISILD